MHSRPPADAATIHGGIAIPALSSFLAQHARLISLALLGGALFFGGLLRMGAARVGTGTREFWRQDWEYYGLGVQLSETGQYRQYPGQVPNAFRMPLYPAAISLIRHGRPGIAALRSVQAALDWAAIAVVYATAAALGGGPCGGVAASLYALSDTPISQVSLPHIESFFGLLLILFICVWIRYVRSGDGARTPLLPIVLLGLALFCRSTLFLLPFLLIPASPDKGWKARGRAATALILGSYFFLIPWVTRNAAIFKRFIPFENGAASINLWGASVGLLDNPTLTEMLGSPRHKDFLLRAQQAPDLDRPRIYLKETVKNIIHQPGPFVLNFFRRLPILWREQWPLLLLALPFFLDRSPPRGSRIVILLLAYFNIHAFMGVTPRYARPVLGVSCVAAALGLRVLLTPGVKSERPSAWLGRATTAVATLLAVVYLVVAGQLFAEAWRWGGRFTYLPTEYLDSQRHYHVIKSGNAAATDFAFQGMMSEAELIFSAVLTREPLFGESLLGRAMVRDIRGDRNGAARDYRALLTNLEFPSPRLAPRDIEPRLRQY